MLQLLHRTLAKCSAADEQVTSCDLQEFLDMVRNRQCRGRVAMLLGLEGLANFLLILISDPFTRD